MREPRAVVRGRAITSPRGAKGFTNFYAYRDMAGVNIRSLGHLDRLERHMIKTTMKPMFKNTRICLLAPLLLTSLAFAQGQPAASTRAPGCGALDTRFDVKTDKDPHSAQPEAGKALVYFIQDD